MFDTRCIEFSFIFVFFYFWSFLHHSLVFVHFVNIGMYREQKLKSTNIYNSLELGAAKAIIQWSSYLCIIYANHKCTNENW
jgi:hypothetical protein